ncbi:hypothetical protein AYX14_07022 [Cryptococcus neoformans]|nr:hypothetical protein AYX15_07081 [Cryptococcus neoformans var. grubii]OWZ61107.1 hypothetical protein AYX14_07022 [Cryptococcus neoformans var. grubii]
MPPRTRPPTRNQIRLQQQHSRPPVDDRDNKVNFEILFLIRVSHADLSGTPPLK